MSMPMQRSRIDIDEDGQWVTKMAVQTDMINESFSNANTT
jgi:hypothetical protein